MKYLLIALYLLITSYGYTQYQQQVNKCKTVIDYKNGRFLDSLMAIIGNKRIVALGEDTHGTAEFYELRAAITQRLIKEKGFSIVILENPHEDMMALQNGLQTRRLKTLIKKHLFPIYQTSQMREFLAWFKEYSSSRPALHLAGCDDSYYEILPQQLIKETAKYGNEQLNNLCQEFLFRQKVPYAKPDKLQFNQTTYFLLNRIDSIIETQKIQDPFVKELIFQAKTNYVYHDRMVKKQSVSRDEIMGNRINYYAADPTAKIIVWAHSAHIAKYAWLYDEIGLMGATVLQKYPADYIAIGLSGGQGSYSYIKNRFINNDHRYTDKLFNCTLHKSETGSWNELLMNDSADKFLLDFSKLTTAERSEFDKMRPLKLQGYGKESNTGKEYYDVSLTKLFDVLIFLKNTTHTTAMFK
jgi:erythromycin esterase-like protein